MSSSWRYWAPIGVAGLAVLAWAISDPGGEWVAPPERKAVSQDGITRQPRPALARWLVLGGGVEPGSNQVSIEQDIALVGELLEPPGVTLFAGGVGLSPVQVLDTGDHLGKKGGLHRRLGDLFWPQDGRSAHYRDTTLSPHDDARAETVLTTVLDLLEQPGKEPLFVFVAAHGEPGQQPNQNLVRLWGGAPISVVDLVELVEELPSPRPLRMVMATCYSGGFADMAFAGARGERGSTASDRCGLFATTWDTEAAGCDPNPDRRAQESYFLHLLSALRGRDRDGRIAPVDLDGDRRISLAEAHTHVRLASRSMSIPTSTSERWLRHAAAKIDAPAPGGTPAPPELVEEHAVVSALRQLLSLDDLQSTQAKLEALHQQARELERDSADRQIGLEVASADLRIALLERWPVLDDAYHPHYQQTLSENESAIRYILDSSPIARTYEAALQASLGTHRSLDMLDVEMAMTRRLLRAYENMAAATKLRHHDTAAYERFMTFLRCERTLPPLRSDAEPR